MIELAQGYPESKGPYRTVATHAREHFNAVSNVFFVLEHEIEVAVELLAIRIIQILENNCGTCSVLPTQEMTAKDTIPCKRDSRNSKKWSDENS